MSSRPNNTSTASLIQQIRHCTECAGQLPLGPKPVFQFGADAPILLVSQAPGTAAHSSGMPFDDPSGDRLRRWLGVTPDSFYNPENFSLLPMGFCYPGKGKGAICRRDPNAPNAGEKIYWPDSTTCSSRCWSAPTPRIGI